MSLNKSHDPAMPDSTSDNEAQQETQRAGTGAASALLRMKADHALRHKQHGATAAGPGHEDDRTAER